MNKIVALCTLFNPKETVVGNIVNLSKQVFSIVLLDNSDYSNEQMFSHIEKTIYIPNYKNLGLSSAFNKGLKLEIVENSDYLVFFDQDSSIPEGFIDKLCYDFELVSNRISIGCMGPQYFDVQSSRVINPHLNNEIVKGLYIVSTTITSSMLTTYSVLKDIGFWNEDVFLDMADWDICWRMKKKGYKVVLDKNLTLTHTLGNGVKRILGIEIRMNNPIREYYQIRDSILLSRTNYIPLKYRIRFLLMWFIMPPIYIALFPEKKKRLHLVLTAFKDAFFHS